MKVNDIFHIASEEAGSVLKTKIYYGCLYVTYKEPTEHTRKYRKAKSGYWERDYKYK